MDKLISQQAAIDKIKKRLFETALNNVGVKQSVDETLVGVAENRLENWFDELPSVQSETNCSEFPNNSDTISKQAALETIRTMQTYKLFAGDDMLLIDQAEAQTELMMLPSVQPEPEAISEWKKEFREYVGSLDIARDDWKGIIEYIDELPSAQPFNNITMNDVIGNIGGEE